MKTDIVMWTKNGSRTLPTVMERVDSVIPNKFVGNKIVVDDKSTDDTREIARKLGWIVVANSSGGISCAANTALKHVETDWFITLEQDLVLAQDWWHKIPPKLKDPKTAAASGMRFASQPHELEVLQKYVAKKYRGEKYLSPWLRSREQAAFTLGKTLDNTIYKTELMRSIGGFPEMNCNAGVDTILAYEIDKAGYKWFVDYGVQSIHLRKGLKQELEHQRWYGTQQYEIWRRMKNVTGRNPPTTRTSIFSRFAISILTGLYTAVKTREPRLVYVHPLIRTYYLKGLLNGLQRQARTVDLQYEVRLLPQPQKENAPQLQIASNES